MAKLIEGFADKMIVSVGARDAQAASPFRLVVLNIALQACPATAKL